MKVVILAGGRGTRLAEEAEIRPKPMVEIGAHPMMWHIMKHYANYGFNEFVVALGYKGEVIKQYFLDHVALSGNMTISLADGAISKTDAEREDWTLHLVDTGLETLTGGRVARLARWIGQNPFMLTYGDGVSNVDLRSLLSFHLDHGKPATITAVRPPARWGALSFEPGRPVEFTEKPRLGEGWINGGFMVLEPEILDVIEGDDTSLEAHVLEQLASRGELMAYPHDDFWQCMDTLRDLNYLRSLWESDKAPWKTWP